jgi:TRAP-type uncharacterized transport system substrate-binding protein
MTLWIFGALVVLVLATLAYHELTEPSELRVAVGPAGSSDARLVQAFAQSLDDRQRDVRLRVQVVESIHASGEALEKEASDLAVVRPDVHLPSNGLTIAILREEPVLVLAPGGEIDQLSKLTGKRIGLVANDEADVATITALLAHFDLKAPLIALTSLPADQIEAALGRKSIDAVITIAAPASADAVFLAKTVAKVGKGKLSLVPIEGADALVQEMPGLATMDIPSGSLVRSPPVPKVTVKTVAVSYRLMARLDSDRVLMSKITQHLFRLRTYIARQAPSANLIKAPDNDAITTELLPVHQGAIDYYNREQHTFMDRYGDYLWLALFAGGGFSSAVVWLGQNVTRRRRQLIDSVLDRLLCVLNELRQAKAIAELDELASEIDGLVTYAVRYARWRTTSARMMSALTLALDSVRAALVDRRREIGDRQTADAQQRSAR